MTRILMKQEPWPPSQRAGQSGQTCLLRQAYNRKVSLVVLPAFDQYGEHVRRHAPCQAQAMTMPPARTRQFFQGWLLPPVARVRKHARAAWGDQPSDGPGQKRLARR